MDLQTFLPQPALVLIIEDDDLHFEIIRRSLSRNEDLTFHRLTNLSSAYRWLEQNRPDIILSDLYLPDGEAYELLDRLPKEDGWPIILMTSQSDERTAVRSIKTGFAEYFAKNEQNFRELPYLIKQVLTQHHYEQINRKIQQENLRLKEISQAILQHLSVGVLLLNRDSSIQFANPSAYRLLNLPEDLDAEALVSCPEWSPVCQIIRQKIGEMEGLDSWLKLSLQVSFERQIQIQINPIFSSQYPDGVFLILIWDSSAEQERERLYHALYRISTLAAEGDSPDTQNFYAKIEEILHILVAFDLLCFGFISGENSGFEPLYCQGSLYEYCVGAQYQAVYELALNNDQPLLLNRQEIVELFEERVNPQLQSILAVPFKSAALKQRGILALLRLEGSEEFSIQDLVHTEILTRQLIQVLDRLTWEKEEKRQRMIAQTLLKTASALSQSLSLQDVFEKIVEQIRTLIKIENFQIWLLEDEDLLRPAFSLCNCVETAKERRWLHHFPFFIHVLEQRKPAILRQSELQPIEVQYLPRTPWLIGAPLSARDEVIGWMILGVEQPAGQNFASQREELEIIGAFSHQAGQAIHNAQLYEDAQRLSIVDELTGLYNRRGLHLFAEQEFNRAKRFERPLAFIFCDINNFKMLNDRYSYAVGDEALRQIGRIFQTELRSVDTAARYGGDEFCILMPECRREDMDGVVRRLQTRVEESAISYRGQSIHFSMTFGAAWLNPRDEDWKAVIQRAAAEMQQKKRKLNNVSLG